MQHQFSSLLHQPFHWTTTTSKAVGCRHRKKNVKQAQKESVEVNQQARELISAPKTSRINTKITHAKILEMKKIFIFFFFCITLFTDSLLQNATGGSWVCCQTNCVMLWRVRLSSYWIYFPYPPNPRMSELVISRIFTYLAYSKKHCKTSRVLG